MAELRPLKSLDWECAPRECRWEVVGSVPSFAARLTYPEPSGSLLVPSALYQTPYLAISWICITAIFSHGVLEVHFLLQILLSLPVMDNIVRNSACHVYSSPRLFAFETFCSLSIMGVAINFKTTITESTLPAGERNY